MRQYPSSGENSKWVNARLWLQQSRIRRIQVADLAFHTCFGNFCKVEKHDRRAVDKNTNGKKQSKDSTGKIFLQKKGIFHHKSLPLSTVCFSRLTTLPSFAAGQLVVSQTHREWCIVMLLRCCCRPFRLVELAAKYTPPPGLCILNSKTHPYWLQTRKFIPRVLTPYQSRATAAVFRVPLILYRPRRVAAMDRTLTPCCSLRPDVPLSHYRAALRFRVLDEVQEADTLISRSFLKMQEIYLFVP